MHHAQFLVGQRCEFLADDDPAQVTPLRFRRFSRCTSGSRAGCAIGRGADFGVG